MHSRVVVYLCLPARLKELVSSKSLSDEESSYNTTGVYILQNIMVGLGEDGRFGINEN